MSAFFSEYYVYSSRCMSFWSIYVALFFLCVFQYRRSFYSCRNNSPEEKQKNIRITGIYLQNMLQYS